MIVIFQTNLDGHRLEYILHVMKWCEESESACTIWVKDVPAELKYSEIEKLFKNHQLITGDFNASRLAELRASSKNLEVVFLDGDNALSYLKGNLRHFATTRNTFLMLRVNAPSNLIDFRGWTVLFSKFLIMGAAAIFLKVKFKKLVFLEKRKFSILRGVRDPLPISVNHLGIDEVRTKPYTVSVIGTIDPRKSIDLVIESFHLLSEHFELRLAGRVSRPYKESLHRKANQSPRITVFDQLLSEEEIDHEYRRSDVFLALQRTNAPSGTILRALAYGVPVVVGGSKVLKLSSKLLPNNVIWTKLNSAAVSRAIERARQLPAKPLTSLPSPKEFAEDLLDR